jgi:hypothetical protein
MRRGAWHAVHSCAQQCSSFGSVPRRSCPVQSHAGVHAAPSSSSPRSTNAAHHCVSRALGNPLKEKQKEWRSAEEQGHLDVPRRRGVRASSMASCVSDVAARDSLVTTTRVWRTVGILGGGQLGRMLALAARDLNIRTVVLDPTVGCPAGQGMRGTDLPSAL